MTDKYRVHEIVKFDYSDIGEYIDEYHTDRPLRNDILVELLNELNDENKELKTKLSEFDFLKNENKHMRTVINENMQLKKLLRKISNCNGEIWLSNGRIIRLKKIFNGEWIK